MTAKQKARWNYVKAFPRMFQWFVLGNFLYYLTDVVEMSASMHTGLLAGANVTIASWVAYWVDVTAFKTFDKQPEGGKSETLHSARLVCRAIIFGACILSFNWKLA